MGRNAHTFQPGNKMGKGRVKGSKNRVTVLREAIMDALNNAGGVEYLEDLAKNQPKALSTLLAKVMPTQVTGENGGPIPINVVTGITRPPGDAQ